MKEKFVLFSLFILVLLIFGSLSVCSAKENWVTILDDRNNRIEMDVQSIAYVDPDKVDGRGNVYTYMEKIYPVMKTDKRVAYILSRCYIDLDARKVKTYSYTPMGPSGKPIDGYDQFQYAKYGFRTIDSAESTYVYDYDKVKEVVSSW